MNCWVLRTADAGGGRLGEQGAERVVVGEQRQAVGCAAAVRRPACHRRGGARTARPPGRRGAGRRTAAAGRSRGPRCSPRRPARRRRPVPPRADGDARRALDEGARSGPDARRRRRRRRGRRRCRAAPTGCARSPTPGSAAPWRRALRRRSQLRGRARPAPPEPSTSCGSRLGISVGSMAQVTGASSVASSTRASRDPAPSARRPGRLAGLAAGAEEVAARRRGSAAPPRRPRAARTAYALVPGERAHGSCRRLDAERQGAVRGRCAGPPAPPIVIRNGRGPRGRTAARSWCCADDRALGGLGLASAQRRRPRACRAARLPSTSCTAGRGTAVVPAVVAACPGR